MYIGRFANVLWIVDVHFEGMTTRIILDQHTNRLQMDNKICYLIWGNNQSGRYNPFMKLWYVDADIATDYIPSYQPTVGPKLTLDQYLANVRKLRIKHWQLWPKFTVGRYFLLAADFTFSINQHCWVFMVSDNYLDEDFQFVKDMLL